MEQVVCNLCGSTEAMTRYVLPDWLLERKDVVATFVECKYCGLVYQNPRPTLAEMPQHYPPQYQMYQPVSEGDTASGLLNFAIRYGIAKRVRFVTRYRRAGRLLDVGCATGVFLQGVRSTGQWEVEGVEMSEYAAQTARDLYHLQVYQGTLEQAAFADESFDAVTLWDVLEHLHDPRASLCEIRRILKSDGILVLRVPNASGWDARLFGRYWAGFEPPRHLYVFTPATLNALLAETGYSAVNWTSGIAAYTTFLQSVLLWTKAQSVPSPARERFVRFLHHPVMRLATVPIFYLGGLGVRGPQVVVTAKKRRHV